MYGVDGSGVIIGIIDQEIDPTNDDFYFGPDTSKVLYFWDQDATSGGSTPWPYTYGQEWTKSDFDLGVYSYQDISVDTVFGHGTLMAGIAAGTGRSSSGPSSRFEGVASGAELVLVSLPSKSTATYDNLWDALKYILTKAGSEDKPCVVNISSKWNPHGPRDGTSDLEADIADILVNASNSTDSAFICVVAAGNEGWDGLNPEVQQNYNSHASSRSHAYGFGTGSFELDVPTSPTNQITPDTKEFFVVVLWYDGSHAWVRVCSPTDTTKWISTYNTHASVCNDTLPENVYFHPGFGAFTINNERWDTLGVQTDPFPGRQDKYCDIYFYEDTLRGVDYHIPNGKWSIQIAGFPFPTDPGWWDAYVVTSRTYVDPECVQIDSSNYVIDRTITEPACVDDVISVASVNTKNEWNSVYTGYVPSTSSQFVSAGYPKGDVSFFSSRGGSRANADKPEAFAPGAWVSSSIHRFISTTYPQWLFTDDPMYAHNSGTSVSAPHVAGAIALALEANGALTVDSIKAFISAVPTVDGKCFNVVEFMHLAASPDCRPGDVDGNEMVDIDDIIFLINYIFQGGPSPEPYCCGDVTGTCYIDIEDVQWLIKFVFEGGPEPIPSCYTCEYPVK